MPPGVDTARHHTPCAAYLLAGYRAHSTPDALEEVASSRTDLSSAQLHHRAPQARAATAARPHSKYWCRSSHCLLSAEQIECRATAAAIGAHRAPTADSRGSRIVRPPRPARFAETRGPAPARGQGSFERRTRAETGVRDVARISYGRALTVPVPAAQTRQALRGGPDQRREDYGFVPQDHPPQGSAPRGSSGVGSPRERRRQRLRRQCVSPSVMARRPIDRCGSTLPASPPARR